MEPKPRFPIRRFDVFAEYQRATHVRRGMPPELAKGRGIWAAKVVAGRRYGAAPPPSGSGGSKDGSSQGGQPDDEAGFRSVGREMQTDATFDREIVDRMGADFYRTVFSPAIEAAVGDGLRYEDIRDAIRKTWK